MHSLSENRIFEFWKEIKDYDDVKVKRFSIYDYIRDQPMPDKERYCIYLWNANYLAGARGVTANAFPNTSPILGGSSIITDRVWLWTRDTVIYVDEHNLWLPDEFREHIVNNNFEPSNYESAEEREAILRDYYPLIYGRE